jgi:hypothetical protein
MSTAIELAKQLRETLASGDVGRLPLLEEAAALLLEQADEEHFSYKLIMRQGRLLDGVVNAIRGEPDPDSLHSTHDAADLARLVMGVVLKARVLEKQLTEFHTVPPEVVENLKPLHEAVLALDTYLERA